MTKEERREKKWWNGLSDEEKFQVYKSMQKWGRFEADTVNQITDHLLGKNWYACDTGNCYNVNPIVIETIKSEFPCADDLYCEHRFFKFIKWLFK